MTQQKPHRPENGPIPLPQESPDTVIVHVHIDPFGCISTVVNNDECQPVTHPLTNEEAMRDLPKGFTILPESQALIERDRDAVRAIHIHMGHIRDVRIQGGIFKQQLREVVDNVFFKHMKLRIIESKDRPWHAPEAYVYYGKMRRVAQIFKNRFNVAHARLKKLGHDDDVCLDCGTVCPDYVAGNSERVEGPLGTVAMDLFQSLPNSP
ncbi:hypothetical protein HK102_012212, partial [Quaeritorhiza haematococci]